MPFWVFAAFAAVQIVAGAIVIRMFLRSGGLANVLGSDLKNIMDFSDEMEHETEEYLRTNWSGDPATLAVALNALLDRFEARVRERALPVTRAELKPMLGRLVLARRLARSGDVQEALKQVA